MDEFINIKLRLMVDENIRDKKDGPNFTLIL